MTRAHSLTAYALAPYYPRGAEETAAHVRFQQLVYALKDGRQWKNRAGQWRDPAEVIARYLARNGCPPLLPDSVLVPMPRKTITPRRVQTSRWPALKLARALCDVGLGADVPWVVRRARDVRSARENPRDRPTIAEHIASLELRRQRLPDANQAAIVLIDDVVTRGTMFASAVQMIRSTGWDGSIHAFSAAWTRRPDDGDGRLRVKLRIKWNEGDRYPQRKLRAD